MDFPKCIKQHKNESDSIAILLYKFRDLGIFRNFTERDYGIDSELELYNDHSWAFAEARPKGGSFRDGGDGQTCHHFKKMTIKINES